MALWKLDRRPAQKVAYEYGQAYHDESTGLPLDPKLVDDAVNDFLELMRERKVYHQVPGSFLTESGLKPIGTICGRTQAKVTRESIRPSQFGCPGKLTE